MARGRARYQRGRVVATKGGGWEIHYNVYLTDPTTGKPKRHHRSRVVGYKAKMHRADAEKILAAELAAINGGPVTRAADGTITFGNWMRNFYIPMRGANWRDATRRTNLDYLTSHVYPTLEHVALKDVTKFQVQMLLNRLAAEEYSYTVVYHVRDLIKAALAEALDQEVLERNVARKTVIPEIEESDKPVLPVEMYAKLLAGLDGIRDRAIFLIACFCALAAERTIRSDLGMLHRQCVHYREYRVAWSAAAQENKTQEPLRTYQLQAGRDPPSRAQGDRLVEGEVSEPGRRCPHVPWDASSGAKATGDADSSRQLATPAPVPGREETRDGISSYVSGAAEELLHAWQERSTPDRDAGPTRTQRHSYHPGHLYADYRPGSSQNGEPGHKPHTWLG